MSNDIFQVDKRSRKAISKLFDELPKRATHATAGVLNTIALTARQAYIDEIDNTMTVRSEGWLKKNMKADLTKGNMPITRQESFAGSVSAARSTGWIEQQTGKRDTRTRTILNNARTSGSFSKTVRGKNRMKRSNHPKGWKEFRRKGGGYNHRTKGQAVTAMINAAREGDFKENFIIPRGTKGKLKNYSYGLYAARGGKIIKLQDFENEPDQPKRNKWMSRGNNGLNFKVNLDRVWAEQIERQLKFVRINGLRKVKL